MMAQQPSRRSQSSLAVVIGLAGLLLLVVGALGYAAWESGTFYGEQRIRDYTDEISVEVLE